MIKNKKFIIAVTIFASCLGVSRIVARYVFTKSDSKDLSGTVDVKDRTYTTYDILLKAGYENASCTVTDFYGNNVSQNYVTNFFVAENDDNTYATDVTDSNGNHFVKLKKYYINMSQDTSGGDEDGVITYKLSHTKVDDTYFVCPYFYDKDGNEIDYAYYGKYKGNVTNGKLCSKAGVTPTFSTIIDDFRTYARANGDQYHQTDWCTVFTAQIMFMCYYKSTDAASKITYQYYSANTGTGTQVLGIENIVGGGFEFIDGVQLRFVTNVSPFKLNVSWENKISAYSNNMTNNTVDIGGYVNGYSGYYIKHMNYVKDSPILSLFPKEFTDETTSSSDKYYCSTFWFHNSNPDTRVVYWGAHWPDLDDYGPFYLYCIYSWNNDYTYIGSRLHTKKLC